MTMYRIEECWRWFGPQDPVTLKDIRQTGAKGIVTALHQIPHGEAWPLNEIIERKNRIEKEGFKWSVVESLSVHEEIKTRSGSFRKWIENYKSSMRNVAKAGIPVVTYNFMPVNDWTRTSLDYRMPDGSHALYFDWTDIAVFDLFILQRPHAELDYEEQMISKARARHQQYSADQMEKLSEVVMFGIPGEEKNTTATMLKKIERYKDVDATALRNNLCEFQKEISEVAEECGIRLAIHPDDPPFPVFGLPRIVSTMNDFDFFLTKVDSPANGICFCTGSLGARKDNDLPEMVRRFGSRMHFAHLRNVRKEGLGNFFESDHLDGDNDMYAIVKQILEMLKQQKKSIPFRPDHGHVMLDDLGKVTNPGYSAIGRMRGLAEIRGLQEGILRSFDVG